MENNTSAFGMGREKRVGIHNMTEGNIFNNSYQWQAPETDFMDNTGTTEPDMSEPNPLEKRQRILQTNLLQLLGQFDGIPVNDLWKTFKTIYGFQPRPANYSVSDMNDILPLYSEFIGIDQTPLGPRLTLTKQGKHAHLIEFHPEGIIDEQTFTTFNMPSASTPFNEPRQYQNHSPRQMSYSQAATTNVPQHTGRQQQNGYFPQPSCQQVLTSNNYYTNIQPLTKETLSHAASLRKQQQKVPTVREMLAEPDWSRRASSDWEGGRHLDSGDQDVINEFSKGLSEIETTIQRNIITILAKFHPTGVPVRSIWDVYKKIYKSVPTKQDVLNNKLKSINHIFERFSQTITRKSIEKTMTFVLTPKGVDYAEMLDLLPKSLKDTKDSDAVTNMTRQRLQGSGTGM
ncbi:uncharacterized protein LOC135495893 [Lineus longissimus]|uniref:uncharacterized protein LOC135495893 n=1 Tax=Lineus longissimus TaxID=88925 RepID=UPI002B4D7639